MPLYNPIFSLHAAAPAPNPLLSSLRLWPPLLYHLLPHPLPPPLLNLAASAPSAAALSSLPDGRRLLPPRSRWPPSPHSPMAASVPEPESRLQQQRATAVGPDPSASNYCCSPAEIAPPASRRCSDRAPAVGATRSGKERRLLLLRIWEATAGRGGGGRAGEGGDSGDGRRRPEGTDPEQSGVIRWRRWSRWPDLVVPVVAEAGSGGAGGHGGRIQWYLFSILSPTSSSLHRADAAIPSIEPRHRPLPT